MEEGKSHPPSIESLEAAVRELRTWRRLGFRYHGWLLTGMMLTIGGGYIVLHWWLRDVYTTSTVSSVQDAVRMPVWDYTTLTKWIYSGCIRRPFVGHL